MFNICGNLRKRKFDSECGVLDRKEVWVSLLMTDGILKEYNIRRHGEGNLRADKLRAMKTFLSSKEHIFVKAKTEYGSNTS